MRTLYQPKAYNSQSFTWLVVSEPHASLDGAKLAAFAYADEQWPEDCPERRAFLDTCRIHESYCV